MQAEPAFPSAQRSRTTASARSTRWVSARVNDPALRQAEQVHGGELIAQHERLVAGDLHSRPEHRLARTGAGEGDHPGTEIESVERQHHGVPGDPRNPPEPEALDKDDSVRFGIRD